MVLPTTPDTEQSRQARLIVADVARRRALGELVSDSDVITAHPDIKNELRDALQAAKAIHLAMLAARPNIADQAPAAKPSQETPPHDDQDPRPVIAGYVLSHIVGRGSQAIVYAGMQQATGRRVAIKVMSWEPSSNTRNRTRFAREVDILASIDHPHIVSVIDRGRTPEGSHYFVMPLIDGPSLDEWLIARRSDSSIYVREALAMFANIARALDEAHRMGVIHRDLKPANVRVDRFGQPHVLDFGLARRIDLEEEASFTRLGNVVGSLPWCSPEQATGDIAQMDGRSDVYSLAVMLHHALTGDFPYPVTGRIREVIDRITGGGEASLAAKNSRHSKLSPLLLAVLVKALARSRDSRYSTAAEFAEDLERCARGSRPLAYETRRHRARDRRVRAIMLIASVIVAAGAVSMSVRNLRNQPTPPSVPNPTMSNSVGMTLVRIGPGVCSLGQPPDPFGRPQPGKVVDVRVEQPFWIGKTEVTRGQYHKVMKTTAPAEDLSDSLPVTNITKDDAVAFCRKLSELEGRNYRLPSDVEWEYACRAGENTLYASPEVIDVVGWFAGNSGEQVHPVGRKTPNKWGLFDMHGNAAEWTVDRVEKRSLIDSADKQHSRYFIRGGSAELPAAECDSAARLDEPFLPDPMVGFRIVLDMN